jgi:hypothetical protein
LLLFRRGDCSSSSDPNSITSGSDIQRSISARAPQRMEGWDRLSPVVRKEREDAALGDAQFSERPVFEPRSEALQRFRDRAASVAFSCGSTSTGWD